MEPTRLSLKAGMAHAENMIGLLVTRLKFGATVQTLKKLRAYLENMVASFGNRGYEI